MLLVTDRHVAFIVPLRHSRLIMLQPRSPGMGGGGGGRGKGLERWHIYAIFFGSVLAGKDSVERSSIFSVFRMYVG